MTVVRDERRSQIVAALGVLLQERSYSRSTINAIAQRAGVLPGVVHYYFRSKQQILEALLAHLEAGLQARVDRRLAGATTPEDRVNAFLDAFVALDDDADPHAVRIWVQLSAESVGQPPIRSLWREALDRQRAQLHRLLAAARPQATAAQVGAAVAAAQAVIAGSFQLWAIGASLPAGFAAPAARRALWATVAAPVSAERTPTDVKDNDPLDGWT